MRIIIPAAIIAIILAWALAFLDDAAQDARQERNYMQSQRNALALDRERAWNELQQQHAPIIATGQTVLAVGSMALLLAVFGSLTLALYHWAQGIQHDKRYQMAQLRSQERVLIAQAAHQHPLPAQHYAPHITYSPHTSSKAIPGDTAPVPDEQAAPGLPPVVDLADLDFVPSSGRVLLGLGVDGQPLTVSGKQLMHVALAGATGSGKTNTARLVVAQVLAVGGKVVVANPHWTSYDAESGDDWRVIERRLHLAPAVKPADIGDLLRWLVHDEMERRLERKRAGELPGEGITLYVDELPAIVDEVPDAAKMMGKVLRQGRALRMYLVGASQDFLTKTIGSSSGVREAYRTAFYSGGDLTGARSLLDIRQNEIEEHRLGQGVVYLRSSATSPARLVRVPLASNEGIHRLLADDQPTMERVVGGDTVVSGGVSTPADEPPQRTADGQPMDSAADTARSRLSVQGERVRQAIAEGLSQSDTIRRVWGCEPSTREGQKATREYRAILAEIARSVGE